MNTSIETSERDTSEELHLSMKSNPELYTISSFTDTKQLDKYITQSFHQTFEISPEGKIKSLDASCISLANCGFHPGKLRIKSRNIMKDRIAKQKKKNILQIGRKYPPITPKINLKMNTSFDKPLASILSCSPKFPYHMELLFSFIGKSLTCKYFYIKDINLKYIQLQKKRRASCFGTYHHIPFICSSYSITLKNELLEWFRVERKVRYAMRRLMNAWLFKKYNNRLLNENDPATMEPPKQEIRIFNIKARGSYCFESNTIKRLIEENLGYTKWMIVDPQHPRNPLTNKTFEITEIIELANKLRQFGKTSWILEGYIECKYQIRAFLQLFKQPLTLRAVKELCKNPSNEDTIEFLEEFIEEMFIYHKIEFRSHLTILLWAIKNAIDISYMKEWLTIWGDYYKLVIIHGEEELRRSPSLMQFIYRETNYLLTRTRAINLLGEKRLESIKNLRSLSSEILAPVDPVDAIVYGYAPSVQEPAPSVQGPAPSVQGPAPSVQGQHYYIDTNYNPINLIYHNYINLDELFSNIIPYTDPEL